MAVHRLLMSGYSPKSPEVYVVCTDEYYRVQLGDRTVEAVGNADLIFDDVKVEGHKVYVIRNNGLTKYVYLEGQWVQEDTKLVDCK